MTPIAFIKKITAPGSYLSETFIENSDGCAKSRRCLLAGTFTAGIISSLTAGIYLTGLMLAMGASETYISYATAFASFCGIIQLFAPLIFEKLTRRKGLVMTAKILYHFLNIIALGIIPILPIHGTLKLVLFMTSYMCMCTINYLAAPGMSAWQMQSLPMVKRVNFYTISNIGTMILNQLTAFGAGVVLDSFEGNSLSWGQISPTLSAIILLRIVALIFAIAECRVFFLVKEFPYETDTTSNQGLRLLIEPCKNKRYLQTILIPIAYSFITAIVGQYFSIYLLEDVKMPYSVIALGGFLSTPLTVLVTPLWYKAIRKVVWPKILSIALLGNLTAYALNAFITPNTLIVYFLCILIGSVFSSCINIIQSNLLYLHIPAANRTSYFSFNSILTLLASFLGTNTGILFINLTQGLRISLLGFDMGNKQYLNFISSTLFLLLSIYTFSYTRKKEFNTKIIP